MTRTYNNVGSQDEGEQTCTFLVRWKCQLYGGYLYTSSVSKITVPVAVVGAEIQYGAEG